MILDNRYILVNEVAHQYNVAISNFSPLASDEKLLSSKGIIKMGAITVIDKTSKYLPNYISEMVNNGNYTDLTDLMMYNDLEENFYLTQSQIKRIGSMVEIKKDIEVLDEETNTTKVKQLFSKKFVKLNPEILEIFRKPNTVIYPLNSSEIQEPFSKELIEKKQFKQIDKETFLVWY